MTGDQLATVAKVMPGIRDALDEHARSCCSRVSAIAVSDFDHARLSVSELWSIPILGAEKLEPGRVRLLCERHGVLVAPFQTFEDIQDHWATQPTPYGVL